MNPITDPISPTPGSRREIFRREALQRYLDGEQRVVLPCYAPYSTAPLRWLLAVLLVALFATAAFARHSMTAPGRAATSAVRPGQGQ